MSRRRRLPGAFHVVAIAARRLVLAPRAALADPQARVGADGGRRVEDVRGAALSRGAFHLGARGDVLFLRSATAPDGGRPLRRRRDGRVLQHGRRAAAPRGSSRRSRTFPLVLAAGSVRARRRSSGRGRPAWRAPSFVGSRSYNFHSCYGLAVGFFVQTRWVPDSPPSLDVVIGVQLDVELLALPVLFVFGACAEPVSRDRDARSRTLDGRSMPEEMSPQTSDRRSPSLDERTRTSDRHARPWDGVPGPRSDIPGRWDVRTRTWDRHPGRPRCALGRAPDSTAGLAQLKLTRARPMIRLWPHRHGPTHCRAADRRAELPARELGAAQRSCSAWPRSSRQNSRRLGPAVERSPRRCCWPRWRSPTTSRASASQRESLERRTRDVLRRVLVRIDDALEPLEPAATLAPNE